MNVTFNIQINSGVPQRWDLHKAERAVYLLEAYNASVNPSYGSGILARIWTVVTYPFRMLFIAPYYRGQCRKLFGSMHNAHALLSQLHTVLSSSANQRAALIYQRVVVLTPVFPQRMSSRQTAASPSCYVAPVVRSSAQRGNRGNRASAAGTFAGDRHSRARTEVVADRVVPGSSAQRGNVRDCTSAAGTFAGDRHTRARIEVVADRVVPGSSAQRGNVRDCASATGTFAGDRHSRARIEVVADRVVPGSSAQRGCGVSSMAGRAAVGSGRGNMPNIVNGRQVPGQRQ